MAAHRFWRIRVTNTGGGSVVNIGDIQFRASVGGADETSFFNAENGAAVASSQAAGFEAKFAFSGVSTDSYKSTALPATNAYDFNYFSGGNEKDILQFVITAPDTGFGDAPTDFIIEYSDDGSSYTLAEAVSGEAAWSAGESRTYSVAGALPTGITSLSIQHVPKAYGVTSLAIQHVPIYPSGITTLYVQHIPKAYGVTSLAIQHIPTYPSGISTLHVQHIPKAYGVTSLAIQHVPNSEAVGAAWRLVIMLDGVDVSDSITGVIEVGGGGGVARIADFVMRPIAGLIDSQAWVRKPVTIDHLSYSGGALQTQRRRFTGSVSDAVFDPVSKLTTFECSDLLQEGFEGVDRSFIDDIIGGYYSEYIFNETESGWEYAQQRLESQNYFYDKDVNGAGRKWHKLAGPVDVNLTTASILNDSLTVAQARARDIINTVEIEFNYRLPRKWQREITMGWVFPQSFSEWLGQAQIFMPNKSMFLNALGSSWWVKNVSFSETPPSGEINGSNWINNPSLELILSANATVATRWNQDITEKYTITVRSQASIEKFGEIKETARYSLDAADEEAHEASVSSGSSAVISSGSTGVSPDYLSPEPGSIAVGSDYYLDGSDRADFDNAVQTAIALARVDILDSHHLNEIGCDVLVNPLLDIGQTIDIQTPNVSGRGVLVELNERYSLDDGSAIASLVINIYAPNASGQDDDAIASPSQVDVTPDEESPTITLDNYVGGVHTAQDPLSSLAVDVVGFATDPVDASWRGLLTNYTARTEAPAGTQFYPFEFRIEMPEVEATLRDQQEFTSLVTLDVAIPQENLTISG